MSRPDPDSSFVVPIVAEGPHGRLRRVGKVGAGGHVADLVVEVVVVLPVEGDGLDRVLVGRVIGICIGVRPHGLGENVADGVIGVANGVVGTGTLGGKAVQVVIGVGVVDIPQVIADLNDIPCR